MSFDMKGNRVRKRKRLLRQISCPDSTCIQNRHLFRLPENQQRKDSFLLPLQIYAWTKSYQVLSLASFAPHALKGQEAPSPWHRPGLLRAQTYRPVRAKLSNIRQFIKLLPLQGALLELLLYPWRCPWARSFGAFSPFLNHMRKFSIVYQTGNINKSVYPQ